MSENGAFIASQNGTFIESQNGARGGGGVPAVAGQLFVALRATEQADTNPGGWPVPLLEPRETLIIQRYNAGTGAFVQNIWTLQAPLILADITVGPPARTPMQFDLKGFDRSGDVLGILYTVPEGQYPSNGGTGIEQVWYFTQVNANTGGTISETELGRDLPAPAPEWLRAGITEAGPVFTVADNFGAGQGLQFFGNAPPEPLLGNDQWWGGVTLTDRDDIGEPGVRYWLPQVTSSPQTTLARNGTVGRPEFTADFSEAVFTYNTWPSSPLVWGVETSTTGTGVRGYDHAGNLVRSAGGIGGPGVEDWRTAFQQYADLECSHFYIRQDGLAYQLWRLETQPGLTNPSLTWGPFTIDNQAGLSNVNLPDAYFLVGEVYNDP